MLQIMQVKSSSDLKKFIRFPYELYSDNQFWVPPLYSDEIHTLKKDINPAFEFCEAEYWLAVRDGKVVGRVAGIINNRYHRIWNKKWARFGWIDFIDDPEVSGALLKTVEDWAAGKGMTALHGPMGFCGLDREGMLVKGFDELGTLATIYNHPYYPAHLERHGYGKDTDMVEYEISTPAAVPERIERISRMVMKRGGYRLVDAKRPKDLLPYAKGVFNLLNSAYKHIYGTVSLSNAQIEVLIKQYFPYINPDLAKIVLDRNGEMAGFGIAIPSLSRALQKAGGRIIPFGFLHILKALRKNDRLDLYLIAVRPDLQGKGVNAIILTEITKGAINNGMSKAESNPEWEENGKVQTQWDNFERRLHKRRRIYVKSLAE